VGRPPLSRLRRRFAPLRGTQHRCAALRAAPPGRYAPRALRAQAFWEHEKNAYFSISSAHSAQRVHQRVRCAPLVLPSRREFASSGESMPQC